MRLTIDIEGLKEVQQSLQGFSDRRLAAAAATALTRTTRELEQRWQQQLGQRLDRPTPRTQRATLVIPATAQRLEATLLIKDRASSGGRAPVEWLAPQERGGQRFVKKFEQALQSSGAMPDGSRAVPAKYATRDGYGNVSRGQIVQVLAQVGAQFSPGYQRVISKSAARRAATALSRGRQYIAVPNPPKGSNLQPGIYQKQNGKLLPIFFFTRGATYRKRIDLVGLARDEAPTLLTPQLRRAIQEQIGRLAARSS